MKKKLTTNQSFNFEVDIPLRQFLLEIQTIETYNSLDLISLLDQSSLEVLHSLTSDKKFMSYLFPEVKECLSKYYWKRIRRERFGYLDDKLNLARAECEYYDNHQDKLMKRDFETKYPSDMVWLPDEKFYQFIYKQNKDNIVVVPNVYISNYGRFCYYKDNCWRYYHPTSYKKIKRVSKYNYDSKYLVIIPKIDTGLDFNIWIEEVSIKRIIEWNREYSKWVETEDWWFNDLSWVLNYYENLLNSELDPEFRKSVEKYKEITLKYMTSVNNENPDIKFGKAKMFK